MSWGTGLLVSVCKCTYVTTSIYQSPFRNCVAVYLSPADYDSGSLVCMQAIVNSLAHLLIIIFSSLFYLRKMTVGEYVLIL